MNVDSRRVAFEHHRLELFKAHGFEASAAEFADSDGHRTAAVVGGEGERPVLLLHGMFNEAGEWALVAGNLSGRLVIPDWPGCGLSDAVPIGPVGFRRFGVDWLTGLVDALGAEQVDIVGSSMGGYLGCVYALAQPERVRRLVQIGSEFGLWYRRRSDVLPHLGDPRSRHLHHEPAAKGCRGKPKAGHAAHRAPPGSHSGRHPRARPRGDRIAGRSREREGGCAFARDVR